jgi:crossover junction endodeoxyribonuclease RuvC
LWKDLEIFFDRDKFKQGDIFAAIEEGFVGKNIRSADTLAKIRGIVTGFCISRNIEIINYSPREIKKALTGNGNASKEQVADMLKRLLSINTGELKDDETDALAVAYCHALYLKRIA